MHRFSRAIHVTHATLFQEFTVSECPDTNKVFQVGIPKRWHGIIESPL